MLFSSFASHLALAQSTPIEKQNTITLSGQLRSRLEYRNGDFRPLSKTEDPAALVLNRVRLNMDYSYLDVLKTKISLQNVNVWGQANPIQTMDKSGNTIGVFEAWADIKLYDNLHAKVGRQTIVLDDERIFGVSDWTNSARSHDAFSLSWIGEKVHINTYLAYNQNYDALNYNNNPSNPAGNLYNTKDAQSYKTMQTLWMKYKLDSKSYLSVLVSNIGFQQADSIQALNKVNNLQTIGLHYSFNYAAINGNLSGYYQFGISPNSKSTAAYLLAAKIGTHIHKNIKVNIGTDYLSGNTMGAVSSTNRSFNTLFHTGHKFYGNMDYFYAGSPFRDVGLMDNYLNFQFNIQPKVTIGVVGHLFAATTEMTTNNISYSKNLGQEIDVHLDYKMNKFVDWSAGCSFYFSNNSLLITKNVVNASTVQNWAWLSLNIRPEFFKSSF